ncbi:MAG TPA: response regulator transcription factor [Acidimicrobiales bacterium]|nr:response regulator transcription factor [Acidimicrobiales bacterium]
MPPSDPIRIAVIDDYDVIVEGTAALLRPYGHLVDVVSCTVDGGPGLPVEVALIDCFALPGEGSRVIRAVAAHPNVGKVVVYTWGNAPELITAALAFGADGFVSKGLSGRELAESLVAVARGEQVVRVGTAANAAAQADGRPAEVRRWPGHEVGLTERESEVLAHIAQGRRTAEIADSLYLSINSIKTHTRNLFRKIGVSTRTEAALWGIDHGFRPDRSTRDTWSSP